MVFLRSPYLFIAVSIIAMLITGVRPDPITDFCPGICSVAAEPDCDTLCISLGYPGGYCRALRRCCCNPKSSKSSIVPPI
ncbi:PREDICTED: putative defensin-like protein 80 [Camelina sativa]|uniref:Defensin-like protein 80 n=1 Tax=Camelina sativa TaxID=90675 RepID=A0ABM1QGA0_CAMSA|nr:PREDICTED: putative defensin-like protein 80 [Camelina sativa]